MWLKGWEWIVHLWWPCWVFVNYRHIFIIFLLLLRLNVFAVSWNYATHQPLDVMGPYWAFTCFPFGPTSVCLLVVLSPSIVQKKQKQKKFVPCLAFSFLSRFSFQFKCPCSTLFNTEFRACIWTLTPLVPQVPWQEEPISLGVLRFHTAPLALEIRLGFFPQQYTYCPY